MSPLNKQMLVTVYILHSGDKKGGRKKKQVLSSLGLGKGRGTGPEHRGAMVINKVPAMSCHVFKKVASRPRK